MNARLGLASIAGLPSFKCAGIQEPAPLLGQLVSLAQPAPAARERVTSWVDRGGIPPPCQHFECVELVFPAQHSGWLLDDQQVCPEGHP